MSDTVKLIIDIPKELYTRLLDNGRPIDFGDGIVMDRAIRNGTPLDDVKAEIEKNAYPIVHGVNNHEKGMTLYGILQVLDNIGKAEKEGGRM